MSQLVFFHYKECWLTAWSGIEERGSEDGDLVILLLLCAVSVVMTEWSS